MAGAERAQQPEPDRDLAWAYSKTFIGRFDMYPAQRPDGRYVSIKRTLSTELVAAHLQGFVTLGAYALDRCSQAKWICLDADTDPQWQGLLTLADSLTEQEITPYLELSRRGGHLWLFFPQLLPGADARRFGHRWLAEHNLEDIELFPKQDKLITGPGSLVRLPLGIHRKTVHRYHFIHPDGSPIAPTIREQIQLLANPQTVPLAFVYDVSEPVSDTPHKQSPRSLSPTGKGAGETLSARIKDRITVYDFVSQYVELNERGQGLCPFHDDQHASFSVNQDENYWHCFAGCGGGSVIDFWSKWREAQGQDASFEATIKDLAEMLF